MWDLVLSWKLVIVTSRFDRETMDSIQIYKNSAGKNIIIYLLNNENNKMSYFAISFFLPPPTLPRIKKHVQISIYIYLSTIYELMLS